MTTDLGIYDYDGRPISLEEYGVLMGSRLEDTVRWRVGLDRVGDWEVSTVWTGLGLDDPPLIFETMIFYLGEDPPDVPPGLHARYATAQEAAAGHVHAVAALTRLLESA